MSPSKSYLSGRRFEYERMKHYRTLGLITLRTAGSHGPYDLIVISPSSGLPTFIQCKLVTHVAQAAKMCKDWQHAPPIPAAKFHQTLEVRVKGLSHIYSVTV